jgi:hypothetical protein
MASDYSPLDRLLHRIALGSRMVGEMSFDIDAALHKTPLRRKNQQHVFISGLARAGTTILMRTFHGTGQFRSLTYRDMPFVLMPATWSRISRRFRKHGELKERAHGDQLLVDFDSPEAFEEVFWRTYCGPQYIARDYLKPHEVDEQVINNFRDYVSRIIVSDEIDNSLNYLSKNNNNILRLPAIVEAFPAATILIPFRSPQQQAQSLLEQHLKFSDEEAHNRFTHDYMSWLGHFEFGLNHRPFRFTPDDAAQLANHPPGALEYWLLAWCQAYEYLLEHAPGNAQFVCYEDLCQQPRTVLQALFEKSGITTDVQQLAAGIRRPPDKDIAKASTAVVRRANDNYAALRDRSSGLLQR